MVRNRDLGGVNAYFDEAWRQECLAHIYNENIRRSRSPCKSMERIGGFNVKFDHRDMTPNARKNDSVALKTAPGSVYNTVHNSASNDLFSTRDLKANGLTTGYGMAEKGPYDYLTGNTAPPRSQCVPGGGGHVRRVPVGLLSLSEQAIALEGDPRARSPSPTRAGIRGPNGETEQHYINMEHALRPPSHSARSPLKGRQGALHTSFTSLVTDRTKHIRTPVSPRDMAWRPVTSSQEVGWSIKDAYKQTVRYPRAMCSETRYAESVALGPRHAAGHTGQGAV